MSSHSTLPPGAARADHRAARSRQHAPRIQTTKLAPPAAMSSRLLREDLLAQMDDTDGKRLILIRAAAGFGKTTLMQQYHERCLASGRKTLWLNIDAADNDLERFLAHLDIGLRALEPADAEEHDSTELSQDLLERLNAIDEPFAIFLDELETLQNPPLLDFIQQMLEHMPPCGVLLITSRSTPDIGLGRLRARGQLLEINPSALRFSLDEATRFIRDKHALPLADAEIATLYRCTEGWVTALYLASLSLQGRQEHAAFVASFSGSNLELAEYLTEDILARQSEDCRQFLLDSSILNQFNAALCDAVTGCADSAGMLEQLERNNLFIFSLDNEHQWFRYHSLFASFLRDALERRQPGRAKTLHRNAAAWYLAEQRPVPAIDHLLQAGATLEAATQFDLHVHELTDAGRSRLLLRWADQLPVEVLEQYPRVGLAYAWTLAVHRRYREAMNWVERLERMQEREGLPSFALEAETIRCLVLVLTDRMEDCYAAGVQHIERLPVGEVFQYTTVANVLAYSMVSTGRYDEARRLLSRATLRDAQRSSTLMRTVAGSIECHIDLLQGRLGTALARTQIAFERASDRNTGKVLAANPVPDVMLSMMLYESDQLEEAEQRLTSALPHVKDTCPPDSMITSHVVLARIAYLRGERNTHQRYLADLEQIGQQAGSSRMVCSAWLERARVALLENRADSAEYLLKMAELDGDWESPEIMFYANDVDTPLLLRQRLHIVQGKYAEAAAVLRGEIDFYQQRQRLRRVLKTRLLLALALDGLDQQTEAFEELTQALRFASQEGFMRTFLDEGQPLAELLQRWAVSFQSASSSLGIEPQFLGRLLQRSGGNTDAGGHHKGGIPQEALTTRELEVVRLLAAGNRNKVIAEKMFLSEFTVKTHLRNINAKLGAQGRTEAVAIARARGLLD
ncbi:helix-turn-helix transcriptional regulator [Pseudomonas sp. UL073]|uniref:Helix-turn-helix transcriptional regulator n=1 Tax=Zestomonas insulae TaxID=2809017 RepID=A0ABS2IFL2_9GAMM|nr:LuxR C-terminal-related transcriptional regulator [Pseudomonas insulae]MBM7061879.1 helix-turn-helix transcriptional regulator [Pseudomonas insulae]